MASNDTNQPEPEVVLVFLDEEEHKLYQLKQWLQPLERLGRKLSVEVWYASGHAAGLLAESPVAAVRLRSADAVRRHLTDHLPRVFLYVNQSLKNSQTLCDSRSVHVFVSHGESDKAYMYQNTIKRYDLCFAAGDAALRRLSRNVDAYDVASRVLLIGRPQILDKHEVPDDFPASGLTRVLYAPTWEGVTKATRYSSIDSHGYEIVSSLLDHGGYQVIYRPHPLAGTRDARIRGEDRRIRDLIQAANARLPKPLHYADSSAFGWQLGTLDAMITDISAVAYDWLATGKALLLTRPDDGEAVLDDFLLIQELQPMAAVDATRAPELLEQAIREARAEDSPLVNLLNHYFGDGAGCDDLRFEQAVRHALDLQRGLPAELPSGFSGRKWQLARIQLWLNKLNISIRRFWTWIGVWNLERDLKNVPETAGEIHVHFSSSFGLASPRRALKRALDGRQGPILIGTNHVLTWLYLISISAIGKLRPGSRGASISVLPIGTAGACEKMVRVLAPRKVIYLKHDPANHMMLRSNGCRHVLFHPETDPRFEPEHTLITYDEILSLDPRTRQFVERQLEISRPEISPREPG